MSIATLPARVQTLTGQIKQADADTVETELLKGRAVKALELAERNHAGAIERAGALRAERVAMQREAFELIGQVGEPPVAAGEEAISLSAVAEGEQSPSVARQESNFGDGPAPVRRVALHT